MMSHKIYTKEEVESSYQFKITKRLVLKEFDWITDIFVNESYLESFGTIFLIGKIDPIKFCNEYDTKINWFFNPSSYKTLSVIFDISFEDEMKITNDIEMTIKSILKSDIPNEFLLDRSRRYMSLQDFFISKDTFKNVPAEYISEKGY